MTVESYLFSGNIVEEELEFTLVELSHACAVNAEWLIMLVEEGVLEPQQQTKSEWRFSGPTLKRIRTVQHLQRDLGVNLAGAALALDLLGEVDRLRARLAVLEEPMMNRRGESI
ncbi:MAG: chaperone modulator CbpM [Gammaproteobacteria bacterium]|nr:chaperone modulator CbpM [Gammaproteobacteria bacterium]